MDKSQKYFQGKENYVVVLEIEGSRLILCQLKTNDTEACYICFHCTNMTIFQNLGNAKCVNYLGNDAKLCSVIFEEKM